jgi:hypothetical protein
MNNDLVKYMVGRFLSWRLPESFAPDAGISFKADYNEHTAYPMKHRPTGTNLFDATQAEAMVRHMLEDMPITSAMIEAGVIAIQDCGTMNRDGVEACFRAMIAASEGGEG